MIFFLGGGNSSINLFKLSELILRQACVSNRNVLVYQLFTQSVMTQFIATVPFNSLHNDAIIIGYICLSFPLLLYLSSFAILCIQAFPLSLSSSSFCLPPSPLVFMLI